MNFTDAITNHDHHLTTNHFNRWRHSKPTTMELTVHFVSAVLFKFFYWVYFSMRYGNFIPGNLKIIMPFVLNRFTTRLEWKLHELFSSIFKYSRVCWLCFSQSNSCENTRCCIWCMVFQQSSTFRIRHVEFLIDLKHSINQRGCSLGSSVLLFLLSRNLKCNVASVIESK